MLKFKLFFYHRWFTSVVDGTELGPVYPIQLKPLKYEGHEVEGVTGAMVGIRTYFGINIHISVLDLDIYLSLFLVIQPTVHSGGVSRGRVYCDK